jgi:hypothetical protein
MNRRNTLCLSTIGALSLVLLPGASLAQTKTLKEQLVGTWLLVSNHITPPAGTKQQFYGAGGDPKGMLVLDAGGRYALVQGRPDRPRFKSASRLQLEATPEELKATILGFGANMGTWSVNEADKTLIRKYEIALIPNNDALERKDAVTLAGDELKLVLTSPTGAVTEAVYRRFK